MLWQLKIQRMHVLLTMQSVDPKIQQQTAHTDTAGTIGDSSHQHSCRSRGSDGQNASHSAYTSYSAWPSLVAGSCKMRNKKAWMQTQCYSDHSVHQCYGSTSKKQYPQRHCFKELCSWGIISSSSSSPSTDVPWKSPNICIVIMWARYDLKQTLSSWLPLCRCQTEQTQDPSETQWSTAELRAELKRWTSQDAVDLLAPDISEDLHENMIFI